MSTQTPLSSIVAGPVVRHCDVDQVNFWLVTTQKYSIACKIVMVKDHNVIFDKHLDSAELQQIQVGKQAFINLISIKVTDGLPENELLAYDFCFKDGVTEYGLVELLPDLVYPNQSLPSFVIKKNINKILHGSCRKPHFKSSDALCQVDNLLKGSDFSAEQRPSMLMMSGDQVYADDVSGPMLVAIHQVITLLGLFDESWRNESSNSPHIHNNQQLLDSPFCYYQREKILPHERVNRGGINKYLSLNKQPIFTSDNAKNHLVTFAEVMAMYLLVWSPELWGVVDLSLEKQTNIPLSFQQKYQDELIVINDFSSGLTKVRRAMAHLPSYMIFDDHDVTDDWNLTRGWEEAAYNNSFSKYILGNALIGYWLCQGWGNAPDKFTALNEDIPKHFTDVGIEEHTSLINKLFSWEEWHYTLATSPKVVVLDTRTRRWRSESNAGKPSGLMDWESLSELQQELINETDVIVVSPAPIYGVKLIETIQRIFTFFGKPLLVDAENWMAHPGTANVMLNIFRHYKTPPNFIILSGDVHYSFVYEVTHRFIRSHSKILQVTCSGIKNQFPSTLLNTLEKLNRFLYATYSPLNWFTKRRRMKIKVRKFSDDSNMSLYNGSGIGLLKISDKNQKIEAFVINADTGDSIEFTKV
ncbi:alkaline phosphatase family protein [Colwellia sp. C2M11]|nr:alkaline phosphatase family protein [Colwellia sp. C2M11]